MRAVSFLLFLLLLCTCLHAQYRYPSLRKEAFDTTIQGIRISDPYFWLSRPRHQQELQDFARRQAQFATGVLDSIPGDSLLLQELEKTYEALQDEIWNMQVAGGYIYYNRDVPGEGATLCRRKGPAAPEEKLLQRVRIAGQSYTVRKRVFAHRQPLVALMLTQRGESNPQIRIFNLDTKTFLPDSIAPVMFNDARGVSMTWMPDDAGLLYTQAPPTEIHAEKYFNGKIRLHRLGAPAGADSAVFGIGLQAGIVLQPGETPYIYSFPHSPYLLARIRSGSGDNYAFAVHSSRLNGAKTPWIKLQNYINLGDGFDARDNYLYAVTKGGARYQVVQINMETGAAPSVLLPEQKEVLAVTDVRYRSGIVAGKESLYLLVRQIGNMQVLRFHYATSTLTKLPVSEKSSIDNLMLWQDNDLIFCQSSPLRSSVYQQYTYEKENLLPLPFASKRIDISGELENTVLLVPSRDGKQIPVSLVYARNAPLQSERPVLIEAYGNAGSSHDPGFDPSFLSFIRRGGIYAYAHVRGGGELGEDWYLDGQFPHKMNSVNDVVDVAQWLQQNKYGAAGKVFVLGASAGSFLVGNAINQRPDLFGGGIYLSGLPDLATHSDAAGAREEKSVGPKNTKEGFLSNYQISALYHVPDDRPLPAMLIVHGGTDYILSLDPVARYAATLQEKQAGKNPILFLTNWEGGHLGGENELLYILKFIGWRSGFTDFQKKK